MTWKLKAAGESPDTTKALIYSNLLELFKKEKIFTKNFIKKLEKREQVTRFKHIDTFFEE